MSVSHAYLHCKPDGTPFYVGKGTEQRLNSTTERNRYYGFVVDKYGKDNILKGSLPCSSDKIAFDLEMGIIKCLKRMGVKLTNMSEGGEGFKAGHVPWSKGVAMPEEVKKKVSIAKLKFYEDNPEIKKHLSEMNKIAMTKPGRKEQNRQNMLGNTYRKGCTHTPEAIKKMSEAHKGFVFTKEHRAKIGAKHKGNTVAKGRIWVNNGKETKMVYKDNIPSGFNIGRKLCLQ